MRATCSPFPEVALIRNTNTEEVASVGGQGQCGSAVGISPGAGYRHTTIRNDTAQFEFNNSNQDTFNANLGYQRPALGRLSLYGNYTKGTYINRNVLGLPDVIPGIPNDGVESYSAGLQFERSIGTRASA